MPLEPELLNLAVKVYRLNVALTNVEGNHGTYLVLCYVFPLHSDNIHIGHPDTQPDLILQEVGHQPHLVINVQRHQI